MAGKMDFKKRNQGWLMDKFWHKQWVSNHPVASRESGCELRIQFLPWNWLLLEAAVGQSVPWEVRTGPAARCAESCWQCVPRAPSSNPWPTDFTRSTQDTVSKDVEEGKERPQRPLNWRGLPWQWSYWRFLFSSIFPSSFAQFSKMNRSICCCLIRGENCLSLDLWVACQGLKDCVISCIRHASCGPAQAACRPGLQSTAPAPAALLPTHSGRQAFPWHAPAQSSLEQFPSRGQPSVSHTPRKTGERVCAQRTYVELGPPLTAPPLSITQGNPTGSHGARPHQTWLLTGISLCTSQQSLCVYWRRGTHCPPWDSAQQHDEGASCPCSPMAGLSHHFTHRSWMEPCSAAHPLAARTKFLQQSSRCMQWVHVGTGPVQIRPRQAHTTVRPADTGVTHHDFYPVCLQHTNNANWNTVPPLL